jgi:hypothetical protein
MKARLLFASGVMQQLRNVILHQIWAMVLLFMLKLLNLVPAPLPADLGAFVLLLVEEELNPEPALEQIVQLTINPKFATPNLVVSLVALALPLPA